MRRHAYGSQEDELAWIQAASKHLNRLRSNPSMAARLDAADPTRGWARPTRSAGPAPRAGWTESSAPRLTRAQRISEMRSALAYADPSRVDAAVWADTYDLVPRDVIDAAASLGFRVIDPCWPEACLPYSGTERNPWYRT